ncbi:hypothetical protein BDZ45DRAFT_689375 [Acephala macrosclerotiorum]|nr:hypothetical protein BDZ45DRAFT_689375 [Acephala macrosclerotiorum]
MGIFNNLVNWHKSQYVGVNPIKDAYLEVFCAEKGPDGHPPRPDELGPDEKWDGNYCNSGVDKPYAFSYQLRRFYWIPESRYYTIICPKAWNNRYTLEAVNNAIIKRGKENIDMTFLYTYLRGQTWLHEFLHHNPVSNPYQPVTDLVIKGRNWPINSDTCYGPDASAAMAKWYGSTTPVSNSDGGYNNEFGTAINADNYAMFAMSVYFQESLSRQAPFEPNNPGYKDIQKSFVDPVPNHPDALNFSGDSLDTYDNSSITDVNLFTDATPFVAITDRALCIDESIPDPFQQPFSRSDTIGNINAFCQDSFKWDFQMVPPISYGNGKTPGGANKAIQFDNSVSSSDRTVKNGIWLNVIFFDEGCMGSIPFAWGSTSEEKTASCTNQFMSILDGCQTDTQTAKYGGALATGCLYYQIQGRTANTTDNYIMGETGPLICNPT